MIKALNSVQIEQLRQISAYLYQVRQKQAIALEDVAQHTYIPLRLLQALEAGEVDRLPEPVYIKGFIRRYADLLGLDGAEIADALELDVRPPEPEEPESPQMPAQSAPAQATSAQKAAAIAAPQPSSAPPDSPPQRPLWKYGVAGLAVLGLVGAIAGISQLGSRPTNPPSPNTGSTGTTSTGTTSNTTPDAPSATTISPAPTPSPSSPSSSDPVQVSVNLTDASWMEVVVDGKTTFEGTLPKGTQRTWSGKQSVVLRSGNAGAVQVSYNDGETKTLGALGSVVDASFPPAEANPAQPSNSGQSNPGQSNP